MHLLQVGAFFGALGAAPITQRIGRKYALFVGSSIFLVRSLLLLLLSLPSASLTFALPPLDQVGSIAQTCAMHDLAPMYAGRVIAGFGVGISECLSLSFEVAPLDFESRSTSDSPFLSFAVSTVCPTYVAEMAPKSVRGRITGLFQSE